MKRPRGVAAAALLVLGALPAARPAEYHVAPGGADADPGTEARPFATIQRAQAAAQPGDTVYVHGGRTLAPANVGRGRNSPFRLPGARAPVPVFPLRDRDSKPRMLGITGAAAAR